MKMIVAVVRPELLPCIQLALKGFDIESMTVTEVHDYASQTEQTLIYRSAEIRVRSSAKLRVEIVIHDIDADDLVDAIVEAGVPVRKGFRSDCKLYVLPLEHYLHLTDNASNAAPAGSR
jgi:nitrogen regulatory protein P-II 1